MILSWDLQIVPMLMQISQYLLGINLCQCAIFGQIEFQYKPRLTEKNEKPLREKVKAAFLTQVKKCVFFFRAFVDVALHDACLCSSEDDVR